MAFNRSARRGFTWLLLVVATLTARVAGAQTTSSASISVSFESSLPRIDPEGNQVAKRSLQLTPEAVSFQDCVDDQRIRLTLLLGGYAANAHLEVWGSISGIDCGVVTARTAATKQCWPVFTSQISLQPQVNVDIPVRAIMSGAPPNSPLEPLTTADVCGTVDLANIGLQILYFDPGNLSQAAVNKTVQVTVDTVGPAAPTGLVALPGNTRVQVQWANISGGDPDAGVSGGLTELTGVKVYCEPSGGGTTSTTTDTDGGCQAVPLDAGDAGDGGTVTVCSDAGISTTVDDPDAASGTCSSANLVPAGGGTITPDAEFDRLYQCGSFTGNSGTTVVAGSRQGVALQNGTRYAVAVAATDKYGNVGPLSGILCQVPEETTDFWEGYRSAGGLAGGCSTTETQFPLGTAAATGIAVVFGASLLRRRRNRR